MRGVSEVSGLRGIRTMHSGGKRSISRVQSSAYLDLYILKKEKERLGKEIYILDKRKEGIQKRLDDIDKDMDKLQQVEDKRKEERVSQGVKKPEGKGWKTMDLRY